MAENYSSFSVMIGLPNEEARNWLSYQLRKLEDVGEPDYNGAEISLEEGGLWVSGDYGISDEMVEFIQSYMRKFNILKPVIIETANYCSKPRVGEFGGSWLVITQDETVGGDTLDAAMEAADKIQRGK